MFLMFGITFKFGNAFSEVIEENDRFDILVVSFLLERIELLALLCLATNYFRKGLSL